MAYAETIRAIENVIYRRIAKDPARRHMTIETVKSSAVATAENLATSFSPMPTMINLETLRKEAGERIKRRLETIREQADRLTFPWSSEPADLNATLHELEMACIIVTDLLDFERDAKKAEAALSIVDENAKAYLERQRKEDRAAVAVPTTDHDDHPDTHLDAFVRLAQEV